MEAENAARKKAAAEASRRQKEIDKQREAEEERQKRQKEEQERILRELEAKRKANEEQRKGEKAQRAAARQREREEASRRAANAQAQSKADLARLTQTVQQKVSNNSFRRRKSRLTIYRRKRANVTNNKRFVYQYLRYDFSANMWITGRRSSTTRSCYAA